MKLIPWKCWKSNVNLQTPLYLWCLGVCNIIREWTTKSGAIVSEYISLVSYKGVFRWVRKSATGMASYAYGFIGLALAYSFSNSYTCIIFFCFKEWQGKLSYRRTSLRKTYLYLIGLTWALVEMSQWNHNEIWTIIRQVGMESVALQGKFVLLMRVGLLFCMG